MNESGRNDTEIITAAQMRALEQAAIARGRVTGASLMEQAGQGAAQAITRHWPDGARRMLIMCGAGNNGGDGYVVARHLLGAGWRVDVVASAPPRSDDARQAAAAWQGAGGQIAPLDQLHQSLSRMVACAAPHPLVVVDALLGLGQNRSPENLLTAWWDACDALDPELPAPLCVAVDLPTGYDSDTGAHLCARPFAADLVITFHACKPVHNKVRAEGAVVTIVPLDL